MVELEDWSPGRETGHHTAAVPQGYISLQAHAHTAQKHSTTLSLSNLKFLIRILYICVVIWGTHSVECELKVECTTSGLCVQGVGEQCGLCVCNADVGSVDGSESE